MLVHVFKDKVKNEESGYVNTTFRIQGVDLEGLIPVRICYFGKPVYEPEVKMVKVVDKMTGKPIVKDGKEVFEPELDAEGHKVLVKDEKGDVVMKKVMKQDGKELLRDEDYGAREEILEMFAGVWSNENPLYRTPVHLILRPVKGEIEKWRGYLVCGNEEVPVEVIDFSTAEKPDWSYEKRKRKFFAMGEKIS